MESILLTLVAIAILVFGMTNIAMSSFTSIDKLIDSWKVSESFYNDIRQTEINCLSSSVNSEGNEVLVEVKNSGRIDLANFNKWDVIMRYQDGITVWIPYGEHMPGWMVEGIYINGKPEIVEPDIFNPEETLKIKIQLLSPLAEKSTNIVNVTTPNGVSSQITVVRE